MCLPMSNVPHTLSHCGTLMSGLLPIVTYRLHRICHYSHAVYPTPHIDYTKPLDLEAPGNKDCHMSSNIPRSGSTQKLLYLSYHISPSLTPRNTAINLVWLVSFAASLKSGTKAPNYGNYLRIGPLEVVSYSIKDFKYGGSRDEGSGTHEEELPLPISIIREAIRMKTHIQA
jgi:hypothetical protein